VSDFIINLSFHQLSETQISLLDKGLSFIPTVKRICESGLMDCCNRNIRNLKLLDYFQEETEVYDLHKFSNTFVPKSTWIPPDSRLTEEAVKAITQLDEHLSGVYTSGLTNPRHSSVSGVRCHVSHDNLVAAERQALQELRSNPNIILKQADKGGSVVLMDTEHYRNEGLRQLENVKYYEEIQDYDYSALCDKINATLTSLRDRKFDLFVGSRSKTDSLILPSAQGS